MLPLKGILIPFLFLITYSSCIQYELRGNCKLISKNDIHSKQFNDKIEFTSNLISQIIGNDFLKFQIFDYQIHGQTTPVFHAHLTIKDNSKMSRNDIIDRINNSEDLEIYFLRQIETPTIPIPHFDDVSSCSNGGVLLPNATCACNIYTSGSRCEVVTCRNNGIAENGRCACPPGVYSPHCEPRSCIANIASAVDFSAQSLILVINIRSSMTYDLSMIISNLQELINSYDSNSVEIANYIVTVYRSTKSSYFLETSSFESIDDLMEYLQSVVVVPSTEDQYHLDAIYASQSTVSDMRSKSNVFVFADSENHDDPTPTTSMKNSNDSLVIQQTLSWRNRIILVLSQWPDSPITPFGDYFDVFRRIVTATHGDLIIIDKTEIEELLTHTFHYLVGSENTFVQYYNNQTKNIPILSDSPTATTYALITCENGCTLPDVQYSSGASIKPTSSGKRFALYRVQQSVGDQICIVGDNIPVHNIHLFFTSSKSVLISYSNDVSVDNGYAHTFSAFDQFPSLYSSFPSTNSASVSRLDPKTSEEMQGSAVGTNTSTDCIFQFKFDAVSSCIPGPFVHSVNITTSNATYHRVSPGYCFTPDSHKPIAFDCLNGGKLAGLATCNCTSQFTGQHCEVPICQNGGSVDRFPNGGGHGKCICPFGVTGSFCEIMTCNSTSTETFQTYSRSFAVVIQNSLSAAEALSGLYTGLGVMLNNGNSTDFEDFVVTTYKHRELSGEIVPQIQSNKFSDPAFFLAATTPENIEYSYSPTGSQPGLLALETTLNSMDYDKSSIFLFTDSSASLPNTTMNYTDILKTAIIREIEISIVIIPPYGRMEMCLDERSYEIYDQLAIQSGGNFINLCQNYTQSGDPITNFIASYGSTHHHTEVVDYYQVYDCSNFTSDEFYISDRNTDSYAVIYSPTIESFNVQLIDSSSGQSKTLTSDAESVPFFASFSLKLSSYWSLGLQLNVQTNSSDMCFVRITERSQFSVYLGFSPDPSHDLYSKDLIYATAQHPVLHLSSVLRDDPAIRFSLSGMSDELLSTATNRTSRCEYEYIVRDTFSCHTASDTFTAKTIITSADTTIQRTQRSYCGDLNGCLNGGILLNNGTCKCLSGYISNHCELPLCQNGATMVDFKCACPTGFSGDLCQYITCSDWNYMEVHDSREYNFQQIVFVVEANTYNMTTTDISIQKNMQSFLNSTEDPNYPKQYTLITFDDKDVNVVVSTMNQNIFMKDVYNGIPIATSQPSTTRSLAALVKAFDTILENPSIIYLFTSTDPTIEMLKLVNKQRFGVQVNVFHVTMDSAPADVSTISSYQTAIARQSNGRILSVVDKKIGELLGALKQSISENQLIVDDGARNCTKPVSFSFPVESKASSLVIDATGVNITLTVRDEKGLYVNLANMSTFTDTNSLIRSIPLNNHNPGTWTVTLSSPSSCYVQVRAITALQVVPRFTNNTFNDFGSATPRVGSGYNASYITFRVLNSYTTANTNYGVGVSSMEAWTTDPASPWDSRTLVSNVTINPRDTLECSSQYVTPLITWSSTYQKFIVRGLDASLNPYQRTFFFTANATPDDCLNGATVDGYGFCSCAANYTGSTCRNRMCQNGGISIYGLCDCPNGYYGDFCEKYIS